MFHFKHFSLYHEKSPLKIGTDAVLLGASIQLSDVQTVLDIGCGCGIIAFIIGYRLGKQFPNSQPIIKGIDISDTAIEEARKNSEFFPNNQKSIYLFEKISVQELAKKGEKYDLIVSNPPFFNNQLKPQTANHLQGKHNDDTLPFSELIEAVTQLLSPTGTFHLILPTKESETFHSLTTGKLQLINSIKVIPVAGKAANRVINTYALPCERQTSSTTLTLRNSKGEFTKEYQQLTMDYYLSIK
ncbi:MAG: methyltransferase [Bacteroidales bacterium]|nr:methyltransferase [Bacteroidales bacterium]